MTATSNHKFRAPALARSGLHRIRFLLGWLLAMLGIHFACATGLVSVECFESTVQHQGLGSGVARVGDIDGDGIDDFLVSASEAGVVEIHLSGRSLPVVIAPLGGENFAADKFGSTIAAVGDVNGDGIPDFVVSAIAAPIPYVRLFHGDRFTGYDAGFDSRSSNPWAPNSGYGYSVAGIGDINHDGVPDFVIGAPGLGNADWSGAFEVRSGADNSMLCQIVGNAVLGHANLGVYLAGVGDMNGDGYVDIAVGAIFFEGNRGLARVYSGKDILYPGNPDVIWQGFGNGPGDYFGVVLGAGDTNHDGVNDVVYVGAPQYEVASGYVGVYSVPSGDLVRTLYKPQDQTSSDYFGSRGAVADFDGDGVTDLVVGAPGRYGVGSVWGFSGANLGLFCSASGIAGERFGTSLSALGTLIFTPERPD